MENIEKVLEVFKTSVTPLKCAEVADKTGLDKKEIDKYIKKLTQQGKLYSPARCVYTVKK